MLDATLFGLDAYYQDLPHLSYEERCRVNFDHPESLDSVMITEHVRQLSRGESIVRPVYDFSTHRRTLRTEVMHPRPYIIVEGLFTLHWEELRPLYQLKIFMEARHPVCLARREARDVAERGRTVESVRRQYEETVRPMADQFIIPSRRFADLVVPGTQPIADSAATVLKAVASSL